MTLTFENYQEKAKETAIYPREDFKQALAYLGLGLASEQGEVAGIVKKLIRDRPDVQRPWDLTSEERASIAAEISDNLWYISMLAWELGLNLQDVAQYNLDKLASRKERGTLRGSGDDR